MFIYKSSTMLEHRYFAFSSRQHEKNVDSSFLLSLRRVSMIVDEPSMATLRNLPIYWVLAHLFKKIVGF